jgi:hypothetical protein
VPDSTQAAGGATSGCGMLQTVQNRYLASILGCYLRHGEELDYASEPDGPPSRVRSRKRRTIT